MRACRTIAVLHRSLRGPCNGTLRSPRSRSVAAAFPRLLWHLQLAYIAPGHDASVWLSGWHPAVLRGPSGRERGNDGQGLAARGRVVRPALRCGGAGCDRGAPLLSRGSVRNARAVRDAGCSEVRLTRAGARATRGDGQGADRLRAGAGVTRCRSILGGTLALLASVALAESLGRSIRLIVPYPPGGITDLAAHEVTKGLDTLWARPVVVDNRPERAATWLSLPRPEVDRQHAPAAPDRARSRIAFSTSRRSTEGLRPRREACGIKGSTCVHVRQRVSRIHILSLNHADPTAPSHSQPVTKVNRMHSQQARRGRGCVRLVPEPHAVA